jgi:ribosome-binding ATPase YchF (GTP1/OBG family)
MSAADDIKRLAEELAYSNAQYVLNNGDRYLKQQRVEDEEELHTAIDTLQSERDALLDALRSLVALDDGDNAELWPFADEFEAARVAIKKCEEPK